MTLLTDQAVEVAIDTACRTLRLPTIRERAAQAAATAAREQHTYQGFLAELLLAECDDRDERRRARRVHDAAFPRPKRLDELDYAANPNLNPAVINTLAAGDWVGKGRPLCLIGDSGTGKEKNIKEFTSKVITLDKYSDCLEPIRNGDAQALTTDNVILAGLVDQNKDEFEVIDYTFTEEPYGIGLKKGDDDFRSFINDVLEAAVEDGSWAKAWENTAGTVLPTPEPPPVDRY
jgi:hypothetical protein